MTVSANGLAVPYTADDFAADVERARFAWKKYRRSRKRSAIYAFLGCVFEIVTIWKMGKRSIALAQRIVLEPTVRSAARTDPYYALILGAARPGQVDDRTAQKWARLLNWVESSKLPSQSLKRFVRKNGGINICAAQGTLRKRESPDDNWSCAEH